MFLTFLYKCKIEPLWYRAGPKKGIAAGQTIAYNEVPDMGLKCFSLV
jgi:hypothetical protein